MNMDQAFQTFIQESMEMLQEMEDQLLNIENTDDFNDSVNSIFRSIHTIKGSAGLFGLDDVVRFTHIVESLLDKVRASSIDLTEDLVSLLLKCKDHTGVVIDSIENGEVNIDDHAKDNEACLSNELNSYLNADSQPVQVASNTLPQEIEVSVQENTTPIQIMENQNWHISIKFGEDVLRNGMDPLSFLRFLNTIGTIKHIQTLYSFLPTAEDMNPESCYLAYEINFSSEADKATIENVFEFVKDDCELHIVPPNARADEFIKVIEACDIDDMRLGEILVMCGTLTQRELDEVLKIQESLNNQGAKDFLGEIVVNDQLASPEVVAAALNKQASNRTGKDRQSKSVRVDAEKLDHLINLIGELVIASSGIESEARNAGVDALEESSELMMRLVEEVRDGVLNLRMVQIGDTFMRFQRVVRDVSKDLGKSIELKISGAETELDKTVIEKISDPLMHLVRNSIDHGIELPASRVENGKSEQGVLSLNAYHESGSIVIEVGDDGGGLKREKIFAKAIEKGIVDPSSELTDKEVFNLIFEAGFSTADKVSNISGRGVGMDVVRRNIESLRGSIEVDSVEGKGTTIRIRLPLTLAIIDGFLVAVGKASYVVPLDMVVECVDLGEENKATVADKNYINLRGEVLPFIRLRDLFSVNDVTPRRESVVVVQFGSQRAGLVVDNLLGEFQTVIKPLGKLFESMRSIGGSTILGSGEVALILDVPSLVDHVEHTERLSQSTLH